MNNILQYASMTDCYNECTQYNELKMEETKILELATPIYS